MTEVVFVVPVVVVGCAVCGVGIGATCGRMIESDGVLGIAALFIAALAWTALVFVGTVAAVAAIVA